MPYNETIWVDKNDPNFDPLTSPTRGADNLNKQEHAIKIGHDHAESTHAPSDADKTPANTVIDPDYVQTENNFANILMTNYNAHLSDGTLHYLMSEIDITESQINNFGSYVLTSLVGVALGVAELDSNGTVVTSQLPSYVDDVLEYADFASLPATGESGKIYVTLDNNKTYRWSGSAYTEISSSLALGETLSTAYRGDRGKTAYDHSQATHAPSDAEANHTDTALTSVNNSFTKAQRGNISVLTYGATVTANMSLGNRYKLTLTDDANMEAPSNVVAGQGGLIYVVQDATGGRTLTWDETVWHFSDTPLEDAAADKVNVYTYDVYDATNIIVSYWGSF